uniref:Uncharacterized protein n=1 Tax=Panagrolaimus sp. JU765 TaxID=591449 RepID=A0AC34PYH4_9BILA
MNKKILLVLFVLLIWITALDGNRGLTGPSPFDHLKHRFQTKRAVESDFDGTACQLANEARLVCGSKDHEINNFVYSCYNLKNILSTISEETRQEIADEYGMCCRSCQDKAAGCAPDFCECVDMVNLLHGEKIRQCGSRNLLFCKESWSQWDKNDDHRADVGFVQIVGMNIVMGSGGMAAFFIYLIVSVIVTLFLFGICIKYRCFNKNNEVQSQDFEVFTDYTEKGIQNDTTFAATPTQSFASPRTLSVTSIQTQSLAETKVSSTMEPKTQSTSMAVASQSREDIHPPRPPLPEISTQDQKSTKTRETTTS